MVNKAGDNVSQDPNKNELAQQLKLLAEAKKVQTALTEDTKLLSNEVRILREQIASIQTAKETVSNNQNKISSITSDIERIQKEIRGKINKLSTEASVSKDINKSFS